ncbi:MAG: PIN domain-containing protein [Dokdonella sp.]
MTLLVDTSVWSLAFRRDSTHDEPEVSALRQALERGDAIISTGLILQELLQGFTGPKARADLIERFAALPFVSPDRQDHIDAAELRNICRQKGVQLGTIDALLAQLCIRHGLVLLSTDKDFMHAAKHCKLRVWSTP